MYLYSLAEKHHGGEMQYLTSSIFMCVYKERRNSRLIDLQVGHLFCRPAAEMPLYSQSIAAAAAIFNSAAWSQTWKNPRGDSLVGLILAAAWWNSTWQAASARKWKYKHDAAAAEWHKQRERERTLAAPPADSFIGKLPAHSPSEFSLSRCLYYWAAHTRQGARKII